MNLTLKFKTKASRGVLFAASDDKGSNGLLGYLDQGNMKIMTNKNSEGDVVTIRTVGIDLADGMWHFLTVGRKSDKG